MEPNLIVPQDEALQVPGIALDATSPAVHQLQIVPHLYEIMQTACTALRKRKGT
jgi:hypothetical protein